MQCSRCGKNFGGILATLTADLSQPLCPACDAAILEERRKAEAEERRREKEDTQEVLRRAAAVLLTTTPGVDGRRVTSYLGKLLRVKAARKGADAVIAVDMDYAEFSGNRVALIVNGTMVQLASEFGDAARPAPAPERRPTPPPIEQPGAPRRRLLGEVKEVRDGG